MLIVSGPDAPAPALDALADTPYRAKARFGGTTAAAFPTERRVAEALTGCRTRRLPLKGTAGLHHAVRRTDPVTGFEHHGFPNVLLAADLAVRRAPADRVTEVLANRDRAELGAAARLLIRSRDTRARRLFTGFGTCSIAEPPADLAGLGLLPTGVLPSGRGVAV